MLRIIFMAAALLTAAALPVERPAAQDLQDLKCAPDWSYGAMIVRKEGLLTVEQLTAIVEAKIDGEIVKTTLCESGGKYVFKLVVRQRGQFKTLTVDARKPFDR
jgi:uncharacterized membrane protein YkoI